MVLKRCCMQGAKKVLHAWCQKSVHAWCQKGVACMVLKRCCMHGAKKVLHVWCQKGVVCMVPKRCCMHGTKKVLHVWCQKGVACIVPKRCGMHVAKMPRAFREPELNTRFNLVEVPQFAGLLALTWITKALFPQSRLKLPHKGKPSQKKSAILRTLTIWP